MGTRADFYTTENGELVWLGSVAFDGYEWAEEPDCPLVSAKSDAEFRQAVSAILAIRRDATHPEDGWPWPWDTSSTTDYAYYFDGETVKWDDAVTFPDMSSLKKLAAGTQRDSVMIFGN